MATIAQLLKQKGGEVLTISPQDTVLDAIEKMATHNVGSLIVMDGQMLVGLMTERHYAREVILKGRSSPTTYVGDIMSRRVVCAVPEQTVEECMAVMTDKAVRHLPVLQAKKIVGIISIGDLVKSIISDQKFVIDQLERYISG